MAWRCPPTSTCRRWTGRVPVVLIRTPYNNNNEAIVHDCMYFAARGYGAVTQDVRGRWDSDGDWYPFVHEAEDGFDTLEWVGRQPWCKRQTSAPPAAHTWPWCSGRPRRCAAAF